MRNPIAIVLAGIIIAAAILLAFRWDITVERGVVYRLDRWTGRVTACMSRSLVTIGSEMDCTRQ